MNDPQDNPRTVALKAALRERILVLDGATGTWLQDKNLGPEDYGGEAYEGCIDHLVLTRPDVVSEMHESYLEAGADIIETNTFGATPLVLGEFGLEAKALELNRRAAELARAAAARYDTPGKPRFVAGSMGPTTKAISVTGGITFQELEEHFHQQALGLTEGGADYLLVETCQDTRNVKAALLGIRRACEVLGKQVPVAVSCTIESMGTMLAGQGVEAFYTSIMHEELLYVGLNCATGPSFMTDHLRTLAELAHHPVAVMPNAGLPDEDGLYLETPQMMSAVFERFLEKGWVNLIGGCCGTAQAHTKVFSALAAEHSPRIVPDTNVRGKSAPKAPKSRSAGSEAARWFVSGIDALELTAETRPVIVGERTNAVGSRLFRRLIEEEKFEEASDIARRQVNGGAQIIDINLANPDRDEIADVHRFMDQVIRKVKAPLMIDSTDAAAIEAALPYCQGRTIVNSINLEDGEERFQAVVPLIRKFGAAVVVGTIDEDPEQGMAVTRQRKLEIAQRSHDLLTGKYGLQSSDLIFDPLVFPCATGDENYAGSAVETIEGVRMISQAFPQCKTVLGISNVSFGLPSSGREVLNAVFLYHCVRAGLDMAIVNSEKLQRYASIPDEEKRLADALLFEGSGEDIAAFADHFRGKPPVEARPREQLPLKERLSRYIVEGSKDGLVPDLEEARAEEAPMDIINGPLMEGMSEVGRLFNDNKLIVAEVLQSAEAMKAAVSHLEQFMETSEATQKGSIVLATVKGDVHDIGKNLVDIILSNNGFKVINLGIKCPPETLIAACREHRPDMIGLSGLLVKSAQQMVTTADDLSSAGITTPILVGGAALSRKFTRRRIAPAYGGLVAYANDAMNGLDLANAIRDPHKRKQLELQLAKEAEAIESAAPKEKAAVAVSSVRSSRVTVDLPIPAIANLDLHAYPGLDLDEVWQYLNPQMLYGKHLGVRGNARSLLEKGDAKIMELKAVVEQVQQECREGAMQARAQWRFFRATSEGNRLLLHPSNGTGAVESFEFPRQAKADGLALPDYVLPPDGGSFDHVAMFVTTAGEGIRERAEDLKNRGEYLRSHVLQALALETAEAAAEWIHTTLRTLWGFPDPPDMTMVQRFQAKYRGKRYSFGYPACPNLEYQEKLFRVLDPGRIGVSLTEGFMMEPEASVSALVFHHPDAVYFSAGVDPADK